MKIISLLEPFALTQQVIVYENGNKIETIESSVDKLVTNLIALVDKYQITDLEFVGPKKYAKGIGEKFQKMEIEKYNNNNVNIIYR